MKRDGKGAKIGLSKVQKIVIAFFFFIVFVGEIAHASLEIANGDINSQLSIEQVNLTSCTGYLSLFTNQLVSGGKIYARVLASGDVRFHLGHGAGTGHDNVALRFHYIPLGGSLSNPTDSSGTKVLSNSATYTFDDSSLITPNSYQVYVAMANTSNTAQVCRVRSSGYIVVEEENHNIQGQFQVSPNPGKVYDSFTFKVNLDSPLSTSKTLKVSLRGTDGNWLEWNAMSPNGARDFFSYSRPIYDSGVRQYRISQFDSNGSQFGTIYSNNYYTVEEYPPTFVSGSVSPSSGSVGSNFSFSSTWKTELSDAPIVDSTVRYRKSGAFSWTSLIMSHAGSSSNGENFSRSTTLSSAGTYEYQFRASTEGTDNTGDTANWTSSNSFTVTEAETNPQITQAQAEKSSYEVGETAVFFVSLDEPAQSVTMTPTPSSTSQTTNTIWRFERVFDSAGTKTVTFSAINNLGNVSDTYSLNIQVNDAPTNHTITVGLNEHGTVTATGINCPGDCSESYPSGSSITFTATPFEGYDFKDLVVHNCSGNQVQSNNNQITFLSIVGDCEVRALYSLAEPQADYTIPTRALVNDTVKVGDPIELGVRLRNIGDTDSATVVSIDYYISDDPVISRDDTYVGVKLARKLDGGTYEDHGKTFSAPDIAKDYYVGACAKTTPQDADASNDCSTGIKITVIDDDSEPARITSITSLPDTTVGTNENVEFTINTAGNDPDKVEIRFLPNVAWHEVTNTNPANTSWKYSRSFATEGTKQVLARLNSDDATQKTTSIIVAEPQAEIADISVSPERINVGDNATFILTLSAPVDEIRVNLAPNNAQSITQTEWLFDRIFNESGDKTVIFTAYVDGQAVSSKAESIHVYEPNDPDNEAPSFVNAWAWSDSDNSGAEVEQRRVISVSSVWFDPDGDVIHGEVQYSRLGENSWSASQNTHWANNVNNGTEIRADIQLGDIALGQYEYRIRALDKKTDGGDPLHEWSQWVKGGEFTVVTYQNRLPQLSKADKQINRYLGADIRIDLQATDPDDDLHYIEIDWYGDGTGDDRWEPEGDNGEINARFYFSNSFPIPTSPTSFQWSATAYDKSGGKSIKRSGWVNIIRPAPVNTGQQGEAEGAGGGYQNEFCVEKPIDLATGAERDSISLLSVNGVLPIEFTLEYNSLINDIDVAGQGWSYSYGYLSKIVEFETGQVIVFWSDNRYATFEFEEGAYIPLDEGCKLDRLVRQDDGNFVVYRKDRSEYYFDEYNRVIRIANPKAQSIEFEYSLAGRLTKIVEPISGTFLQYEYYPEEQSGFLRSVSDPLGNTVSLEYDGLHLSKIIRADDVEETFTYNEAGQIVTRTIGSILDKTNTFDDQGRVVAQDDSRSDNLVSSYVYTQVDETLVTTYTDKNGHASEFVFDKNYRLLETTNAEDITISREYDANGKVSRITDGRGNHTDMAYDRNGDLVLTAYADGSKEQRVYDDKRNLIQLIDQLDQSEFYAYDDRNNLIAFTDKAGNTTRYEYNNIGQTVLEVSPEGRTTEYEYTNGLLTKITDGEGNSRTLSYDASGRLMWETDFAGNRTRYTYDGMGRKIEEYDATNIRKQSWVYDARGHLVEHQGYRYIADDTGGEKTTYIRDTEGNVIEVRFVARTGEAPIEPIVLSTKTYDGENRLLSETDEKENLTQFVLDKAGRIKSVIDPKGNKTDFKYDGNNNLVETIDPFTQSITNEYDPLNRLVKSSAPLDRVTQYQYDLLGRRVKMVDSEQRETLYFYDPLSNLLRVKSPGNIDTSDVYDEDSLQTESRDANSNIRELTRDQLGRVASEKTADDVITGYEFDSRSNLTEKTDNRGDVTRYQYDVVGRMTQMSDDIGMVNYRYSNFTDLIDVVSQGGASDFRDLDGRNRVASYVPFRTVVPGVSLRTDNIYYGYEPNSNISKITHHCHTCDSSDRFFETAYEYDANNNLTDVGNNNTGISIKYEYDEKNRLKKTIRGNGTVEERDYDIADRITEVRDVDAQGKTIIQFNYKYDRLDRVTEEVSIPEALPPTSLLSEFSASYDVDNRLDVLNGEKIDFDANGNTISVDGMSLEFNVRDQLVQAGEFEYQYDPLGHRVRTIDRSNETEKVIEFLVDPHADLSRVLRRKEIVEGVETEQHFVYGNGLVAMSDTANSYYYHFDYRGSVVAITDQSGTIVQRYGYLPYGKRYAVRLTPSTTPTVSDTPPPSEIPQGDDDEPVPPVAPPTEPGGSLVGGSRGIPGEPPAIDTFKSVFGYNGRDGVMTDPNGLYYMRARYYSPDQRRFLSKDPLRGQIGELASLNRYGYVGGDPINAIDPSGQIIEKSTSYYGDEATPTQRVNATGLYRVSFIGDKLLSSEDALSAVNYACAQSDVNCLVAKSSYVLFEATTGAIELICAQAVFRGLASISRFTQPSVTLKGGYYYGYGMKISKYYYSKLYRTGRPAPFTIAREILASGVKGVPDSKPGFTKYIYDGWELVYNKSTKEIWHLLKPR